MASMVGSSSLLRLSSIRIAFLETQGSPPSLLCVKQRAAVRHLRLKNPSFYLAKPLRFSSFTPSAASGEAAKIVEAEETKPQEEFDEEPAIDDGSSDENIPFAEEKLPSAVLASLESYTEALANNDHSRVAEIEAFLQSIEDERNSLENKVAALSEELLVEKDRILRISADFDNFRKRTERDRLSLMENVQGEVVESLLPVVDNFQRAKDQIKVETEGEEKINSSYQSIYKQFMEILTSLGVVAIETVGNAFDPMLHEAIMREDSTEFEEGIILQEFRKGFKLGERLLRPSMVKVSAGPGPEKPKDDSETKVDEGNEDLDQGITEQGEELS